jgi:hypothetical protein
VSDGLWPLLRRLARRSAAKMDAVAYVTTDDFVEFGEGDTLVVDATDAAVSGGDTDADVLGRAVGRKAEVYSCPGPHAKLLVFGGVVVVGSANMAAASATAKSEAAWVTDSPAAVGMAASFIREVAGGPNRSMRCSSAGSGRYSRVLFGPRCGLTRTAPGEPGAVREVLVAAATAAITTPTAAPAVAAPPTTAAVAASSAPPAPSATESAAAATLTWLRLIHGQQAALQILAAQGGDGGLGLLVAPHLDEREASGLPGQAVRDDLDRLHCAVLREQLLQVGVGDPPPEIADVNLPAHDDPREELRLHPRWVARC